LLLVSSFSLLLLFALRSSSSSSSSSLIDAIAAAIDDDADGGAEKVDAAVFSSFVDATGIAVATSMVELNCTVCGVDVWSSLSLP
jgi:hypothetical protein